MILLAALGLTACGEAATGASSVATTGGGSVAPSSGGTTSGETVSGGVTTYAPRDAPREAASPDPNFDYGFVVQITADGFHPRWLLSGCCRAVTWKNLTNRMESVVFDHQLVDSGPIPPGGRFVYAPQHPVSVTYHSGLDPSLTATLQVQPEIQGP